MAITLAKALSKRAMLDWSRGGGMYSSIDDRDWALVDMVDTFDKVWIISILSPSDTPIFKESEDTICLQFDDVDPDDHYGLLYLMDEYIDINRCSVFTDEQAEKIIRFIEKAHNRPGNDILLVNCFAGISRSGATVTFAGEFCGIDSQLIRSHNPRISPNYFVLDKLRDKAELSFDRRGKDGRHEEQWSGSAYLPCSVCNRTWVCVQDGCHICTECLEKA